MITAMKTANLTRIMQAAVALLLVIAVPAASTPGQEEPDSLRTPEDFHLTKYRFLRSSLEVVGFNVMMTTFGRYIMEPDGSGFVVSTKTIKENLEAGMEWDDNTFSANNFRHPYQGALYFNAAKSNGYDFYQSSAFSFAGAWLWEYTGEAHHPSYNDWVTTAVGGIIVGEALWRLSDMVVDNKARGSGRTWRELGGFAINPMRGINRLITGEAFEVHENNPGRIPDFFGGSFNLGLRMLGAEDRWKSSSTKMFISSRMIYGTKLGTIGGKPFDYFDFTFQLNFNNKPHGLGMFNVNGLLYSWDMGETETKAKQLNANMHLTYVDNEAYTYGGQSLSASYLSRFGRGKKLESELELTFEGIILGASKSDYFNLSNREYDYGPGVGFWVNYRLMAGNRTALRAFYRGSWIHSINGTVADHLDNFVGLRTEFSLRKWFRLGADYVLYFSQRNYRDYPDVWSRNPQAQVYFTWSLD
jgi:hypothetical protein